MAWRAPPALSHGGTQVMPVGLGREPWGRMASHNMVCDYVEAPKLELSTLLKENKYPLAFPSPYYVFVQALQS